MIITQETSGRPLNVALVFLVGELVPLEAYRAPTQATLISPSANTF